MTTTFTIERGKKYALITSVVVGNNARTMKTICPTNKGDKDINNNNDDDDDDDNKNKNINDVLRLAAETLQARRRQHCNDRAGDPPRCRARCK